MKVTHSKIGPDQYEVVVDRRKVAVVDKKVDRQDHVDKRGRKRPRNVTRFVITMEADALHLPKHPLGEEPTMKEVKEWMAKNIKVD